MPLTRKLAAEFIGTFWLVLGGCGSAVLVCRAVPSARWCIDSSPRVGHAVPGIQAAREPSSPEPDRQFAPRPRSPPR